MTEGLSTLETVTGEMQTTMNGSAKVVLFKVRLESPGSKYKEDGLFRKDVPGVQNIGFPMSMPSIHGGRPEVCGQVYSGKYSIERASILKIFVHTHRRRSFPESGNLFIRMRQSAALRRIVIPCPEADNATVTEFSIMGRFDLLKPSEALAAGCRIPEQFKGGYSPAVLKRIMRFTIISPETGKRVILKNEAGEEKEFIMPKRRRMMGGGTSRR